MSKRRVVITGLGAVTPFGVGVDKFWNSLLEGKSGVSNIENIDTELHTVKIAAEIKNEAEASIRRLYKLGAKRCVMLSGDKKQRAEAIGKELQIDEVYSELSPDGKYEILARIMKEGKCAYVGDGINDAPVLARADIGIAMGGLGSDAAIEAADIVIMNDHPSKIATAMKISRKTLTIVKQNIVFAIGIKVLVLIMAAFGMASMWAAVFADVGVAFLAILNAMRAMKVE